MGSPGKRRASRDSSDVGLGLQCLYTVLERWKARHSCLQTSHVLLNLWHDLVRQSLYGLLCFRVRLLDLGELSVELLQTLTAIGSDEADLCAQPGHVGHQRVEAFLEGGSDGGHIGLQCSHLIRVPGDGGIEGSDAGRDPGVGCDGPGHLSQVKYQEAQVCVAESLQLWSHCRHQRQGPGHVHAVDHDGAGASGGEGDVLA